MTDETYDIELTDVSLKDYNLLSTGLTIMLLNAKNNPHIEVDPDDVQALQNRLLRENAEASRAAILTAMDEGLKVPVDIDQDLLEDLGLKQVGGEIVEDEGWEDIDIE